MPDLDRSIRIFVSSVFDLQQMTRAGSASQHSIEHGTSRCHLHDDVSRLYWLNSDGSSNLCQQFLLYNIPSASICVGCYSNIQSLLEHYLPCEIPPNTRSCTCLLTCVSSIATHDQIGIGMEECAERDLRMSWKIVRCKILTSVIYEYAGSYIQFTGPTIYILNISSECEPLQVIR